MFHHLLFLLLKILFIMEQYDIPGMKDTMDETGQVPESIYLFYEGDSQNFVDALEFIGLSPINREFAAFLLSDLGRQIMTQNKLSIHVESGDIFTIITIRKILLIMEHILHLNHLQEQIFHLIIYFLFHQKQMIILT